MRRFVVLLLLFIMAMMSTTTSMAQNDGGGKKKRAKTTHVSSNTKRQKNGLDSRNSQKSQEQDASINAQESSDQEKIPKPYSGIIAGHEWIDLGLPSGLKWATCNVGADSADDHGLYFAWGEINPKPEPNSEYTPKNSVTYKKNISNITFNPYYDAAQANWGGSWRMPTVEECHELLDNCIWTRVKTEGKFGYLIEGPNGNSIYLPNA